jgi:NAD(P)H dehydrogenase (quinone)
MILVTGAAGKTGRSIVQALAERELAVRVLVRHPDQLPGLKALGADQVLVGDLRIFEEVTQAVEGVRKIYHVPPNMSLDEVKIGENVINAARSSGVEHFVYHSVLKPQVEAMPHHWKKMLVEEQLIQSGLPYTILQPAAYMQNLLAYWTSILEEGIYRVPYPAETRLSLVDLQDVAEVAAKVLSEDGHQFAIYELVGTGGYSQIEVADLLSQELERKVDVDRIPLEEWAEGAHSVGLGEYEVETLVKMFVYYSNYGFEGNSKVLSLLLGRPPATLRDFIRLTRDRHLEEKKA